MRLAAYILMSITLMKGIHCQEFLSLGESYVAGQEIVIKLNKQINDPKLLVTYSFGTTLINPNEEEEFLIPKTISNLAGTIKLQLISSTKKVEKANLIIEPKVSKNPVLESYCGPKHLVLGEKDFTMLTVSILDSLDNPYPLNTSWQSNSLIENRITSEALRTTHLIGFNRIFAPNKSGYGAIHASQADATSNEFRVNFYPNKPLGFDLKIERQHEYADGNQLIRISTDILADKFDNVITNGTLVYFEITDSSNRKSISTGEVVEGIASIELVAPIQKSKWSIHAFIPGFASSSNKTIIFKNAIDGIEVKSNHEKLIVGPLESFMGQYVKEGVLVQIRIWNEESERLIKIPLVNGHAELIFKEYFISNGDYTTEVKIDGTHTTKKITVKYE